MTRRAPQDIPLIHKNLTENYEAQFGEKAPAALLREVVGIYLENLKRDFIMNRIDGLTPIESKQLLALAVDPVVVQKEVKALEESFDKAINGQKVGTRKGKGK